MNLCEKSQVKFRNTLYRTHFRKLVCPFHGEAQRVYQIKTNRIMPFVFAKRIGGPLPWCFYWGEKFAQSLSNSCRCFSILLPDPQGRVLRCILHVYFLYLYIYMHMHPMNIL
ncbi:hypothetical protein VPH35_047767 [Triticum aestivum]